MPTPSIITLSCRLLGLLPALMLLSAAADTSQQEQQQHHQQRLGTILAISEQVIPNPQWLQTPQWQAFVEAMNDPDMIHLDDAAFGTRFNAAAANLPFTHYRLQGPPSGQGDSSSGLHLSTSDHRTAILRIDHLGMDGEVMAAKVDQIRAGNFQHLILDLRETPGGSFPAGMALGHFLTSDPVDTGIYLTRRWFAQHGRYPTAAEIARIEPLNDLNLAAFHRELESKGVLRIIIPAHDQPTFQGKLYALTSRRTASAAEPLVDMLSRFPDDVTVIGETTAGAMLSGERFPINDRLVLFAPVADFLTDKGQRLDGIGVEPHISVPADQALDTALKLIAERLPGADPIASSGPELRIVDGVHYFGDGSSISGDLVLKTGSVELGNQVETDNIVVRTGNITAGLNARLGNLEVRTGAIRLGADSQAGALETRNGDIHTGASGRFERVYSRNGNLMIEPNSRITGEVGTRNGHIHIGGASVIGGSLTSRNGTLRVTDQARITDWIETRNGDIRLHAAHAGTGIRSLAGNIHLLGGSEVKGDVIIDVPQGSGMRRSGLLGFDRKHQYNDAGDILIDGGSIVHGNLRVVLPEGYNGAYPEVRIDSDSRVLGDVIVDARVRLDIPVQSVVGSIHQNRTESESRSGTGLAKQRSL